VAFHAIFFLTNYSVNGTYVNGKHYQGRGENVPLHNGDVLAFVRSVQTAEGPALASFLEFRFDLSGSILADADAASVAKDTQRSKDAGCDSECSRLVQRTSARAPTVAVSPGELSIGRPLPLGTVSVTPDTTTDSATSFLKEPFEPCFMLEAGGTAARGDLAPEHRRITHGSPLRAGVCEEGCPPLVLGRAEQQDFWSRLLTDEAFNSLSRQHLRIEACEDPLTGRLTNFCVQNLSARNPIRVTSSLDENIVEGARPMEFEERRTLNHSDVITVNPNMGSSLWLVFMDLNAGRRLPDQRQYVLVQ
jgi:hypothetical protein